VFALRGLDAEVRPYAEYAFQLAHYYGLTPVVTSTFRSWAEQRTLRAKWEAGLSKWPANRPGDSAHNFGWAFDSWVPDERMAMWAAIRQYVGFRVPERDIIHAEVPSWRQFRPVGAFAQTR